MSAFYVDSQENYQVYGKSFNLETESDPPFANHEVEFVEKLGEDRNYNTTDLVKLYLQDIGRIPLLNKDEEVSNAQKTQRYLNLVQLRNEATSDPIMNAFVQAIKTHDRLVAKLSHRPSTKKWAKETNKTVEELKQIVKLGKQRWAEMAGLSVEELEAIQKTGIQAKEKMIKANLRLVVSIAKKYQNRGLELLDLVQEGTLGLEKAVEKFDPTKGYRFSTYSYWWIRQGITRAIATQSRIIRLPVHITEKLNKIKKAQRQISQKKGHTASIEEVAKQLNTNPDEVREVLNKVPRSISLEIRVGQDQDTELVDLIETSSATPEENLIKDAMRQDIHKMILDLDEREKQIINLRFGFEDGIPQSLSNVARILRISRERVRQIEAKAMQKLRQPQQRKQMRDYYESLT
jgi:RNA polymerase nonessential primary-like sigma factor